MKPFYEQGNAQLLHGDCALLLPTLDAESVDAIVTDPPAGIEFMGKEWDSPWQDGFTSHGFSDGAKRVPAPTQRLSTRNPMCKKCHKHIRGTEGCRCEDPEPDEDPQFVQRVRIRQREAFIGSMTAIFAECLRVAKPGAHALVWALPRTSHWTATALEDAGWEIRDCVYHLFGSGFPKSLDVSKAIDKAAGAERERIRGVRSGVVAATYAQDAWSKEYKDSVLSTVPITPAAAQWQGWGTALKPAVECWWLCRKPLSERNVAANVTKWGTGAMNVDGCRVGSKQTVTRRNGNSGGNGAYGRDERVFERINPPGRWPAHLTLDEEAARMLDQQSGTRVAGAYPKLDKDFTGKSPITFRGAETRAERINLDSGGASRFFYTAKASRAERNAGLAGMPKGQPPGSKRSTPAEGRASALGQPRENHHPTVKPLALMRWLCRLITPPGGLVLDPFAGSGTTGCAAVAEGFRFLGIERDADYCEIAARRLQAEPVPLPLESAR